MYYKILFILILFVGNNLFAQRNIDLGIVAAAQTSTVVNNIANGDTVYFIVKMYSNGPDDILETDNMILNYYEGMKAYNTPYIMLSQISIPAAGISAALNAGDSVYALVRFITQGTSGGFNSDVMDSFAINFPTNGFDTLKAWIFGFDMNNMLFNDIGILTSNFNQIMTNSRLYITQNNALKVPIQFINGNTNSIDNVASSIKQKKLDVYPNPATEHFTVYFDLPKNGIVYLKVFDILGKVVMQRNLGNFGVGANEYRIDNLSLKSGSYMIELTTENFRFVNSIIVQK